MVIAKTIAASNTNWSSRPTDELDAVNTEPSTCILAALGLLIFARRMIGQMLPTGGTRSEDLQGMEALK
jgi:hypothetical protein